MFQEIAHFHGIDTHFINHLVLDILISQDLVKIGIVDILMILQISTLTELHHARSALDFTNIEEILDLRFNALIFFQKQSLLFFPRSNSRNGQFLILYKSSY